MPTQVPPAANPNSIIGMLHIEPDNIAADGSYIVALPFGSRPLNVGLANGTHMVLWVIAPYVDEPSMVNHRLWIVPGGHPTRMNMFAGTFIGSVIVAGGSEDGAESQDWHVFFDRSNAPIEGEPQSKYMVH